MAENQTRGVWHNLKGAAAYLGVEEHQLRKLLREGTIAGIKTKGRGNGYWLVSRSELKRVKPNLKRLLK
jgi:excisionase family DNA binding protein